ncbi:MAG: CarD family transcriptional regulator, partial [Caldilineaceae bacterium]
ARPFLAAGLATDSSGPLVIVTGSSEQAQQWVEGIGHFLPPADEGGPSVLLYPEPDSLPFERIPWTDRTRQARLTALAALQSKSGPAPIVVAPVRALLQMTLPARDLRLSLRPLSVGGVIRLEETLTRWVESGYEPADVVEEPGTFARRGGLVDIWPPNLAYPVRIDLFGDEVESLRVFDPNTQRTERKVQRIEIGPGSEALSKYSNRVTEWQGEGTADDSSSQSPIPDPQSPLLADPNVLLAIRDEIANELDLLAQGRSFRGIEWYLPLFYAQPASLLDHLPANATLLIDDGTDFTTRLHEADERVLQLRYELSRSGELPAGFPSSFFGGEEMLAAMQARQPILLGFGNLAGQADSEASPLARSFVPGPRFGGKGKEIVQAIGKAVAAGDRVVLLTRQAARMQNDLTEAAIPADLRADLASPPGAGVTIVQSVLSEGFVMRGARGEGQETDDQSQPATRNSQLATLLLLTDAELFGWQNSGQRKQAKARSSVAPELFFADVKAGDFVVHMEHGIGQYEGLSKLELGGVEREYLQINYAQNDKLYVPVHQADRLSRYVGAGDSGIPPAVTRLGTADWQTVKERAKKAVEEIAGDLLVLYAERELVSGHAFGKDGAWQEEMEAAFPFQETEDQMQAIGEVKRDMESEEPMDRIIIG